MRSKLTRKALLLSGALLPFLGGCGGGSAGVTAASEASSRGVVSLSLNFPAARSTRPTATSRAGGGFIPIGTRAVVVSLVDPNTGAALAPSQTVTAPLSRPGPQPTILSVQFPNIRVGAVSVRASAFPDAAATQTPIATGSASGTVTPNVTTNIPVPVTLTLSRPTAAPGSVSVDPVATGLGHTAALAATVQDASGRDLQLPVYWLSQDPGIATVTFDPAHPTAATVTAVAEGNTVVTLVEPNSGMTATVKVASGEL